MIIIPHIKLYENRRKIKFNESMSTVQGTQIFPYTEIFCIMVAIYGGIEEMVMFAHIKKGLYNGQ